MKLMPESSSGKEGTMRTLATLLIAGLLTAPALADDKGEVKRLRASSEVLRTAVNAPDKGIPKDLLSRAECIGVFPDVKKAAFVVGGEFGRGVFTCHTANGEMSPPAFFTMGGGSFGWQFGGQEADLILLVMNQGGVKHLLQDKFTVGGELSAVAGPVGRKVEVATDAQLHAQILSWSRSRGVFLGASLEGTVVKPDKKTTEQFYGRPITAKEILVDQSTEVPKAAQSFVKTTTQCARRSS